MDGAITFRDLVDKLEPRTRLGNESILSGFVRIAAPTASSKVIVKREITQHVTRHIAERYRLAGFGADRKQVVTVSKCQDWPHRTPISLNPDVAAQARPLERSTSL